MSSFDQRMAQACRLGLAHLEAGSLDEARQRFAEVVAGIPDFAPALHALGMIARQQHRPQEALDFAGRTLAAAPDLAPAHVLKARSLIDLGRTAEAVSDFRAAIALEPEDAQTRFELAAAAESLGADAEAITQYRAALALCPANDVAHHNLCRVLRRAGRLGEAYVVAQERIVRRPDDPDGPFELGHTLYEAEEYAAAAAAFRAALALQPDHVGALENLGATLMELGELDAAEECLRQARAWQPERPGPYNALGAVLRQRGQVAAAESCFRQALALAPEHLEATCNLATTLLLTGRYDEGWRRYEARWGTASLKLRGFAPPLWDGAALAGRTLLLHAEQGFGDALQFCRFIPLIEGGRLILEAPEPLVRLLRRSFPNLAEVVCRDQVLPRFDVHCPLMSLPLLLGIAGADFVHRPTYLTADPLAQADWDSRLRALPGRRVGLVWQGNPKIARMRTRRDLPTAALAAVRGIADISFVSLQLGLSTAGRGERDATLPMTDWTDRLGDWADTAALVGGLDLVIGVDTAVVHLAGALGRPVWLLNRFDTCWRWGLEGSTSPWYPTLRQFRQPSPGDWTAVMTEVAAALRHGP